MAVFNLKAFEAEVDVLGRIQKVVYTNGILSLHGLSLPEAKAAIDRLATGLQTTTLIQDQHAYVDPKDGKAPPPLPETSAAKEKPAEDDLPGDLGQDGKGPEQKGAAKRGAKKQTQQEAKKEEPKSEPKSEGADVVDLAEARPAGGDGDLISKLAKLTKLLDVVETIREAGHGDVDAIVAQCVRLKDQIPVLKKIPNLEERVKRVWERLSA